MDIPKTEKRAFQERDSSYATWQRHRYDTQTQCLHVPYSIAQKHDLDVIAYADVMITGEEPTGSVNGVVVLQGVLFKAMKIYANHWNYTSWQICDYLHLVDGHVPECVRDGNTCNCHLIEAVLALYIPTNQADSVIG